MTEEELGMTEEELGMTEVELGVTEVELGVTVTVWASLKDALPLTKVISLCPRRPSTPARNCSTTEFFLTVTAEKSKSYDKPLTPKASAFLKDSTTSAFLQNAFVGIQPSFRQVPPTGPDSIRTTSTPLFAARRAVSYPPGPAPIIISFISVSNTAIN
jgi:hypothetical protein